MVEKSRIYVKPRKKKRRKNERENEFDGRRESVVRLKEKSRGVVLMKKQSTLESKGLSGTTFPWLR